MYSAKEWFKAINLPPTKQQLDLYINDLLREEVVELTEAHSLEDMLDAIGDMDFVMQGIKYIMENHKQGETPLIENINNGTLYAATVVVNDFKAHHPEHFDLLQQAICYSNFTKFCKTKGEVAESVEHYKQKGIPISYNEVGENYVLRVKESVSVESKFYPQGKVMKSIKFKPPELSKIVSMLESGQ